MNKQDGNIPRVRFYTLKDMRSVRPVIGKSVAGSFPRHMHSSLCLGIVDRGVRCIETVGGEKTVAGPGEMFILNPGQAHSCICGYPCHAPEDKKEPHDYRVLSLDPGLFERSTSPGDSGKEAVPRFDRIIFKDIGMARAMDVFFTALHVLDNVTRREQALATILDRLLALGTSTPVRPSGKGRNLGALVRVREYLDTHCDDIVCLKDLAGVAGLSRFHLQRQFSLHMGVSPREYLLQLRSARAATLLDQGMAPAEVAVKVGFADQSHLTKTFKRFVGITPGRFRTSQKNCKI